MRFSLQILLFTHLKRVLLLCWTYHVFVMFIIVQHIKLLSQQISVCFRFKRLDKDSSKWIVLLSKQHEISSKINWMPFWFKTSPPLHDPTHYLFYIIWNKIKFKEHFTRIMNSSFITNETSTLPELTIGTRVLFAKIIPAVLLYIITPVWLLILKNECSGQFVKSWNFFVKIVSICLNVCIFCSVHCVFDLMYL